MKLYIHTTTYFYQVKVFPKVTNTHLYTNFRNLSLGLATKAKGLQGCEPKGSPRITSNAPGSARE